MLSKFVFALSRRIRYAAVLLILLPGLLNAQTINVRNYGVTTSGDQTSRLNNLIARNPGKTLYFPAGTYYVSTLNINNDITLTGRGVVIAAYGSSSSSGRLVDMRKGNIRIKGITFNGNNKRAIGLYLSNANTTNTVIIDSCAVMNIMGNKSRPGYGIQLNKNSGVVSVTRVLITRINGYEDGVIGNEVGANRGIYINNVSNATISNCTFSSILGDEDGDGIQYYRWDGRTGKVTISGNNFKDIRKRAIKIQSSYAVVKHNKITGLSSNTSGSWAAISVYGNNNVIENNDIDLYRTFCGIEVGTGIKGNKISSNSIKIRQFTHKYWLSPIVNHSVSSNTVTNTLFNGSRVSTNAIN